MGRSVRQPRVGHPPDRGRAPDEDRIVSAARKVTHACNAAVVGGVAVILHGGGRHTNDIDIRTADLWATHIAMESCGIMWNAARGIHLVDGIAVHMHGAETREMRTRAAVIRGVRVISLHHLVRDTLARGLTGLVRARDIAHVIDLIQRIPLKKDFASKLPKNLRAPFKELVEQVHGARRTTMTPKQFLNKYA